MAVEQWADRTGESFQGLLLRHRGRTGLTQRQLAALVGVSRGAIQDWEAGLNYPDAPHLQALIVALLGAGGMTVGAEANEAQALWAAAMRQSRRMQTPFDTAWWARVRGRSADAARREREPAASTEAISAAPGPSERRQDWGEAPSVIGFLGRAEELATLREWVLGERCRLAVVLGIGGIGKTTLAARLAQDVAPTFQRVYWRSLRDAPPLSEWAAGAITFISDKQVVPPEGDAARRLVLVQLLQAWPSLLVLDNFETLLEPGRHDGRYRDGYAGYGRVLQAVAEGRHHSCLVVTSREAPPEVSVLRGDDVLALHLGGLGIPESQALLADKHLVGSPQEWSTLIDRCGGNGLALRVVGESIREVFGGDIGGFLEASGSVATYGGIRRLLGGQFQRSSGLEQHLLRVLAVEREPVTVAKLMREFGPRLGRGAVLEAIEALRRRSLVEHAEIDGAAAFSLQSVVLEYVTDSLVQEVSHAIIHGRPGHLVQQPLIQAQAKDYVRQTQERLIGEPVLQRLEAELGSGEAEQRCLALLDAWRHRPRSEHGFGPGNVVNLLRLRRGELRGVNLAGLAIRQAYLAGVEAQDASLADSHLAEPVLAEAFTHPVAVVLSGDGALVAAGTSTGQVYLWRVASRTRLLAVEAHTGSVHGLALSNDGRVLASGGDDGVARLWDVATGTPIATLRAHAGPIFDVALSADGRVLASGGDDRTARVWDVRSTRLLGTADGHTGSVYGVALSADGQLLASGSEDGSVRLWDAGSSRPLGTLVGHMGPTYGVALSADGHLLASGGLDGTVRLWATAGGQPIAALEGHTSGVWRVGLSPDGKLLASGSWDGTLRLWDVSSGRTKARLLTTLRGRTAGVYGVALSADKRLLANGSEDGTIRIWDVAGGRLLVTLQGDTGAIRAVAMSADGALLGSAGFDGTVRVWDIPGSQLVSTVRAHPSQLSGVVFSANGRLVVSAGLDGTIRLWEVPTGEPLGTLEGHAGPIFDIALSADGRVLASGGDDRTIRLWDVSSGRVVATLDGHTRLAWVLALTLDGRQLASGSLDGTIRLWDATTGRQHRTVDQQGGAVYSLAFSADGRLLASGSQDGRVRVCDVPSWQGRAELQGHVGPVYGVTLDAAGRLLASGGMDGTVRLWDVLGGRSLAVFRGHTGPVYSVAMDADGTLLASSGLDGTIRLWDTRSRIGLQSLRADRHYERLDISGLTGVSVAQRASMLALGAVDRRAAPGPEQPLQSAAAVAF